MSLANTNPAPRMPLQLDVSYRRSYARSDESGTLKNISLSGAFIEMDSDNEVSPEDKIIVYLTVSNRLRKIPAQVIWRNNHGCGIVFNHTNNRDQQIVDDLMYFAESTKHGQTIRA